MRLQPFSLPSNRGISLIDLLVSLVLFMIVAALVGSFVPVAKRVSHATQRASEVNQNLKSVFDYLSLDVRLAGENLPSIFPAILLSNNPPVLTLRRALVPVTLNLCEDITANIQVQRFIIFTEANSNVQGCSPGPVRQTVQTWNEYITQRLGFPFKAFVYNILTRDGFYIDVAQILDSGSQISLELTTPRVFQSPILIPTTVIYLLEELRFRSENNTLIMDVMNTGQSFTLAFDISNVQFRANLAGIVKSTITSSDNWTLVDWIELESNFRTRSHLSNYENRSTLRFFPRNVLSN